MKQNLKQLDKRAVWLFFINFLLLSSPLFIIAFGLIIFGYFDPAKHPELDQYQIAHDREGQGRLLSALLPWLLLLTPILGWIWAKLTYYYYRYELREDGFRKEHGIIWKKYVTIPYERIQNVDIYRGLIARLLGLSDLQVQTAGGLTSSSYGAFSEGRLPGLSKEAAEQLRDELVRRAKMHKGQGL